MLLDRHQCVDYDNDASHVVTVSCERGIAMKYGQVLQRAARITWDYKSLWPFGIALALFGGGAASGSNGSGFRYTLGRNDWGSMQRWVARDWGQIAAAITAVFAVIGIFVLILAIVGIIVRNTSVGALIGMAEEAERAGDVSFQTGLRRGWKNLLPLFLSGLVIGMAGAVAAFLLLIVLAAITALAAIPAVLMFRAGQGWNVVGIIWSVVAGLPLLAVIILAAVVFGGAFTVVREYTWRSIVLGETGVLDAISKGMQTARAHWKESVWMWIVLGLIQMALGLVLTPLFLAIGGGTLIPALALGRATESAALPLLIAVPMTILGVLIMLAIGGIYAAFQSVTWTLVYHELEPAAA